MEYLVLMNSVLKKSFLQMNPRERERLKEKLNYLESGIWDSGLKVKKLKGMSKKVIFEARVDKGDRLIFTIGRHGDRSAIYLWGISKHDDVDKNARTIIPGNAPFLSFKEQEEEEYGELYFDDLEHSYFSQEELEETAHDDYGPQKWHQLDETLWLRLESYGGESKESNDEFEMLLFLTGLQEKILKTPPPLLLSGTAGSGKTTIAVYYLLKESLLAKKRVFITYNNYLKNFARRSYYGLITESPLAAQKFHPDFYVFKDLLLSLVGEGGKRFEPENEVNFRRFDQLYHNHKLYRKYEAELVWQEIRSIIKGAKPQISLIKFKTLYGKLVKGGLSHSESESFKEYLTELKSFSFFSKIERLVERKSGYSDYKGFVQHLQLEIESGNKICHSILDEIYRLVKGRANDFSSPLLTFEEYSMLGKKRAPNFYYNREELYEIACFYQSRLEEGGLWDEIDLCKAAIEQLEHSPQRLNYDFVICDEIQDFTDIQLYFLLKMTGNLKNVLFAGDPKQIINPSSFRWEEVKDKFYERGINVPEVYHMNLNFRSVGSIVRLGNSLLDLKQRLVGLSSSELKEEWKFNGSPPIVLDGLEESSLYQDLHSIGAGQIILVRDKEEKSILKNRIGSELIFTINEAKGLEFDTVLVWKFLKEKRYSDIWRKINEKDGLEQSSHPHIKHEINLLYVAITRARNTIIFYDGEDASELWKIDLLKEHIFHSTDQTLLKQAWTRISTPKEWENQGDYFFEREYYPAAFECYKNSGNNSKLMLAEAYLLEERGSYAESALLFEEGGFPERAAINYQRGEDYENAYRLWKQLKNEERMTICRIHLYEKRGDYNSAAREWLKLGNREKAIANWNRSDNWQALGNLYLEEGSLEKAGRYYERARNYEKAANCYYEVERFGMAAQLYYKAGLYSKAAPLFESKGDRNMYFNCLMRLKDNYGLANYYREEEQLEEAIKYMTLYAEESESNREILEKMRDGYFERLSYEGDEIMDRVLEKETRTDDKVSAEGVKETFKAIKVTPLKIAVISAALGDYIRAGNGIFQLSKTELALKLYKKGNHNEGILKCYLKLNMRREYALLLEDLLHKDGLDDNNFFQLCDEFSELVREARESGDNSFLTRFERDADKLANGSDTLKAQYRYLALEKYKKLNRLLVASENEKRAISHYLNNLKDPYLAEYLNKCDHLYLNEELSTALSELLVSQYRERSDLGEGYEPLYRVIEIYGNMIETMVEQSAIFKSLTELLNRIGESPIRHDLRLCTLFKIIYLVKSYNLLFRLIQFYYEEGAEKEERELVEEIRKSGEEKNDPYLKALYLFTRDEQRGDELYSTLAPLEINESNYLLFEHSKGNYMRAVNYHMEYDRLNEAIECCKNNNDLKQAIELLLKAGRYEQAGDYLVRIKEYPKALDCYSKANRSDLIAKTYETMGEFKKAAKLWEEIGRHKQAERVKRKISMSGIKFEDD